MLNVVFLASWYPSRIDPFDGDFVERHAKAISLYHKVFVIHIVKDTSLPLGEMELDIKVEGNLHTYIAYYSLSPFKKGWLEKALSVKKSFHIYKSILAEIIKEHGKPHIAHLNIIMKAGMFALWTKKKYNIPFVLTEHWTGYYRNKGGFGEKTLPYRVWAKKVFKACDLFLPVSKDLGIQMNKIFSPKEFRVIPNVADTNIMHTEVRNPNPKKRLFHASTMHHNKNTDGLLRTILRLSKTRDDFELHLAGTPPPALLLWAHDRGLVGTNVFFMGQVPYVQIATELRKSDILVMFSRFENLPCIILEALCCGLPVISTNVGGIKEVINPTNGVLITSEKEDELFDALNQMLDHWDQYDRDRIAQNAREQFSYETVGKEFSDAYMSVLKKH